MENQYRHRGKITQAQADEIRKQYKTGDYSQRELGQMYDIAGQTVGEIIRNRIHVNTVLDENGWPVNDQSAQIRNLKMKCTKHEQRIMRLEHRVHVLEVRLGIKPTDSKPEFDLKADQGPRYVDGVDTHSKEYLDFLATDESQLPEEVA